MTMATAIPAMCSKGKCGADKVKEYFRERGSGSGDIAVKTD